MKKIILASIFVSILSGIAVNAQSLSKDLPQVTTIIPYNLQVGYNKTTVIIFPVPVIDGDRGYNEIIVQKQKSVENILNVKAAIKDFQPTNLHVYTTDGKVYSFNVNYVEYPNRTTFDLNKLGIETFDSSNVKIVNPVLSNPELKEIAEKIKQSKPFYSRKAGRYGMKFQLRTIHTRNDVILFGFAIINKSNLDFDIDFTRLYIKDKKKSKRSSIQEQDMNTLYIDSLRKIQGGERSHFVVAVPKFTIPNRKDFFIQIFEENGGRYISLKIKNRHLLKAK